VTPASAEAGDPTLNVIELFGPTFQGEGPSCGRRASFVRMADCNLACAWCDTRYSWDWEHHDRDATVTTRTATEILAELAGHNTPLIVVTGGEPMLQKRQLGALVRRLQGIGRTVEVETNGTIPPSDDWLPDRFVVSLKLAHSGDFAPTRIRDRAIRRFTALPIDRVAWKFVATTPQDLDEVAKIVGQYGIGPERVWIMPEGRDPHTLLEGARALAGPVTDHGWNMTTRLHVLIWGDQRGR
jgi:7-carboxy-7-deazaguanine synthase